MLLLQSRCYLLVSFNVVVYMQKSIHHQRLWLVRPNSEDRASFFEQLNQESVVLRYMMDL